MLATRSFRTVKPTLQELAMLQGRWRHHPYFNQIVAYWMFIEGGGPVLRNIVNNRLYGSISGNLGWVPGKFGNTMDFTGSPNFVNVGDDAALTFGNGTIDFPITISSWVYRRNASTICPGSKYGAGVQEYRFVIEGANITWSTYDDSASAFIGRRTSTITVANNTWHHLLGTYDASRVNSGFAIYSNGVRSDTTNVSSGTYTAMENTNQAFEIGRIYGSSYADGLIDMVAIHARVLSEQEILMQVYDPLQPFRWAAESIRRTYFIPQQGGATTSSAMYYYRMVAS